MNKDKQAEIEAALTRGVRRKRPEPGDTYFGRSMAQLGIDPLAGAYVVGSEPAVRGPLPAPAYSVDNNVEPPLGEDVNFVPDTEHAEPTAGQLMVAQQADGEGDE